MRTHIVTFCVHINGLSHYTRRKLELSQLHELHFPAAFICLWICHKFYNTCGFEILYRTIIPWGNIAKLAKIFPRVGREVFDDFGFWQMAVDLPNLFLPLHNCTIYGIQYFRNCSGCQSVSFSFCMMQSRRCHYYRK